MKKISTSIYTFEDLIRNGMCYVDKTRYVHKLITSDKEFFCSRPRRFGKSLAISTLEAIFQGKRELFKGLFIDSTDYDWKTYPVIHIDFVNCGKSTAEDLDGWIKDRLEEIAESYGVGPLDMAKTSDDLFTMLIRLLSRKGQVVILIDEYDKMVTDHINSPHVEDLRRVLGNFYQVIKGSEALIRFAFITGVTKYAKMGIFSGLNNLNDISMDEGYATMFGYTQGELEKNFAGYIELGMRETGLDREAYLGKMREMYDGYRFHQNAPKVYNPVSVGLFFSKGGAEFNNYWFETGGNTKLVMNVAKEVDFNIAVDLEKPVSSDSLSNFDIAALQGPSVNQEALKWLLYQAGYLTIDHAECEFDTTYYHLVFPNREVASSFSKNLLSAYAPGLDNLVYRNLLAALRRRDAGLFFRQLEGVYAAVVYPSSPSGYDFSIVLQVLAYVFGPNLVQFEVHTSQGRADMVVRLESVIYLFEFKVDKSADEALGQIEEKQYWQRFAVEEKPIHLVGVSFSKEKRNIVDWKERVVPC